MYERITGQYGGDSLVWKERPRAEPPDPKLDRVPLKQLLKETGMTAERLDLAIGSYQHPKPIGRTIGVLGKSGEPIYSRSQIAAWRETKLAELKQIGLLK